MVEKSRVEKSGVKKFRVEMSGVDKVMVEKSEVKKFILVLGLGLKSPGLKCPATTF